MNSKTVLEKIKAALSMEETTTEVVELVQATLPDGTTLESPSFDVGEAVFVISGEEKVPAPDGEHTVVLTDEDDREVSFVIEVQNGVIVEREPVEDMEEETEKVEELPETMSSEDDEADELSSETEEVELEEDDEEGKELEEDEDEDDVEIDMEEVVKTIEDMSYRIEELEKKLAEMMPKEDEEEEVELSKLDGAPSRNKNSNTNQKKKNASPQSLFLSKLYNN